MRSQVLGNVITVVLEQGTPEYRLRVPIAIRTERGEELRTLDLGSARQTFTLDTRDKPLEVILDPDLRLFRRLKPEEAPPILRQVMVDRTTVTVLLPESGEARDAAEVTCYEAPESGAESGFTRSSGGCAIRSDRPAGAGRCVAGTA